MQKKTLSAPQSFENLFEYESFLKILRYYVDLNCFVVPWNSLTGVGAWMTINYHQRHESLYDFEKKYKHKFDFSSFTDPKQEKKRKPGELILLESVGFFDIFMPVKRKGERIGTLLSGAFPNKELTYPHLKESWKRLTGRESTADNIEFREYAKVMMNTPVLEGPVLEAYREALELFARVLVSDHHPRITQKLQELLTNVFSKNFTHSYFVDWALGLPTAQATPQWSLNVEQMDWVKTDIGISRVPTTVITVVPTGPGKRNVIEEMLRIYRFQRRSFRFAQELGQTVTGKLENYGAVFITSADASLGRPQRRRQILDTAEKIRLFAMKELDGPVLMGIGETVAPGQMLTESYRQAVLALHVGRRTGTEMVLMNPAQDIKVDGVPELMGLLLNLKKNIETGTFAGWEENLNGFLKQVLTLPFQNPEEIRWHLQYALLEMKEVVRSRSDLDEKETDSLYKNISAALERTVTTQEMISIFKDSLEKLLYQVQGKSALQANYSIVKIQNHIDKNFRERLNISGLAKLGGMSVSTFSRRFKKVTGIGLEKYLQTLRLEEARMLLGTGSLPVQVAKACGYKPGSHFSRFFKQKTGLSPEDFRKKNQ